MSHTLRVVLDTNVLLSGMAYPGSLPGKILTAWRHGSLDVLLSPFILDELRRVLPRLAHRHGLTSAEMDDLVDVLAIQAEVIEPSAEQDAALRDANDRPVLGTLLAAQAGEGANYLITGDKDLLALADRYAIVTPAAFWAVHGGWGG
jgi:putative PIN family toxin of toxin-antitoxin system